MHDKGMRAAWAAWATASCINWVIWLIVSIDRRET